jgi:hypothetical protein
MDSFDNLGALETIDDVKRANRRAGGHWFSPDTLRFFRGRVGRTLYGGRFFVSSEQFDHDSPRLYTVREVRDGGKDIATVGEFQAYRTNGDAVKRIRELLTGYDVETLRAELRHVADVLRQVESAAADPTPVGDHDPIGAAAARARIARDRIGTLIPGMDS